MCDSWWSKTYLSHADRWGRQRYLFVCSYQKFCPGCVWRRSKVETRHMYICLETFERKRENWKLEWNLLQVGDKRFIFTLQSYKDFLFPFSLKKAFWKLHNYRNRCHTSKELNSSCTHCLTVLWLDSDDVLTILSPSLLVEGYKTVYLCHHTQWLCVTGTSVFPCSDLAVAY